MQTTHILKNILNLIKSYDALYIVAFLISQAKILRTITYDSKQKNMGFNADYKGVGQPFDINRKRRNW